MRVKGGKKAGGQPGHKGQKGKLRDSPDDTVKYKFSHCPDCQTDLRGQALDELIRKQIVDLPPIRLIVIEHQIEVKSCPCCQQQRKAGGCPEHIRHELQYGPRIKALSVYLSAHQFIPTKRIKDMLAVFGVELSAGTLDNFRISATRSLIDFVKTAKRSIIASAAAFFDETGMKVKAVGHWVHVAATSLICVFMLHRKRGREAHTEMGILPFFKGVLHRDDYHSYRDIYNQAKQALFVLCSSNSRCQICHRA
jgi:transposase